MVIFTPCIVKCVLRCCSRFLHPVLEKRRTNLNYSQNQERVKISLAEPNGNKVVAEELLKNDPDVEVTIADNEPLRLKN